MTRSRVPRPPVMSCVVAVVTTLVLGPAFVRAQGYGSSSGPDRTSVQSQPGPRGGGGPGDFDGGGYGGGGFGGRFGGGFGGGRLHAPTEEEWQETASFAHQHTPNRLEALERLDEYPRERLKAAIHARYGQLLQLKESDPQLHELRLRRLELEDEIFGALRDLRHAPEAEQDAARNAYRAKVAALIENGLAERALRLERLESAMSTERERLRNDQARLSELVESRMREIDAERDNPLAEMLMRPRDGDRGVAGRGPERRRRPPDSASPGGDSDGSVEEAMRRRRMREVGGGSPAQAAP